ncbi:MAG: anion transporter, partial [candidate division Zixibacteria bacterium]|nr:anion transporter [candidate division Zixibacteria bacterium]
MNGIVAAVFAVVYLGMIAGRMPGLALDRTGLALLGAIVLMATGAVRDTDLLDAIDVRTIALLFGLMILSAQFRLAGAYSHIVRSIGNYDLSPAHLLAAIVSATALLSALLINDVICLAMTPIVIAICSSRQINPIPYLLGVACASNIGSAA